MSAEIAPQAYGGAVISCALVDVKPTTIVRLVLAMITQNNRGIAYCFSEFGAS